MKTVAIIAQKGGVGKTTLALSLATAAHLKGKGAMIADLDPQASAKEWYDARLACGGDELPYVQKTTPQELPNLVAEAEKQGVEFLILDTPPKADKEAIVSAEQADLVLMVSSPSPMDLRAMHHTVRLTQLTSLKPGAKVVLALNKLRPLGPATEDAMEALRELNVSTLSVGFGSRVDFEYCLNAGQSALEYDPKGQAAQEILGLYLQINKLVN